MWVNSSILLQKRFLECEASQSLMRKCNRCIVVDLSCNCEACSLDAPGVVTPDTAPDISEPT